MSTKFTFISQPNCM